MPVIKAQSRFYPDKSLKVEYTAELQQNLRALNTDAEQIFIEIMSNEMFAQDILMLLKENGVTKDRASLLASLIVENYGIETKPLLTKENVYQQILKNNS